MPALRLKNFDGIIPKISPEDLPESAAQTAENCAITSGNLKLLSVSSPFVTLSDSLGIPTTDRVAISTPGEPDVIPTYMIKNLADFLTVECRVYVIEPPLDSNSQNGATYVNVEGPANIFNVNYTAQGVTFDATFDFSDDASLLLDQPGVYYRIGPCYRFKFAGGHSTEGGPLSSINIPQEFSAADPEFYTNAVPLYYSGDEFMYARFQVVDVKGPNFYETYYHFYQEQYLVTLPKFTATFYADCNYVQPTRREVYYLGTNTVSNGEKEGPASDISEEAVLAPGQCAVVNSSADKLYRSTSGGDDFVLIAEDFSNKYVDMGTANLGTALPRYGNYPTGLSYTTGFLHPAHFGVGFTGEDLYFTDVYRLWVWPEEFKLPMGETISAIAPAGHSIVVFTTNKVFMVSGSSPLAMTKYLVSADQKCVSTDSICVLGASVFYTSNDGMCQVTQGGSVIVTSGHYTRSEWSALAPSGYSAKVADNCIFLEKAGTDLRLDFDEDMKRVTTFTSTSPSSFTWKSKRFVVDRPINWSTARLIAANYNVTLKIYANSILVQTITVSSDDLFRLPFMAPDTTWEFEIVSAYTVKSFEIATSVKALLSGGA